MYLMFTENNDWEGETWNFFIPIKGNEEKIKKIRGLIEGMEDTYELSEDEYTEGMVKKLLARKSRATYMDDYQIIKAVKDLPFFVDWDKEDPFYKGSAFER